MRTLAVTMVLIAAMGTANAAEINAFISTALKTVTDEVIPPFERAGGHTVRALYAPPGALLKHFEWRNWPAASAAKAPGANLTHPAIDVRAKLRRMWG